MKHAATGFRPGRHFEMLNDPEHDPYQARLKLAGPAVCGRCGAVYEAGKWSWRSAAPEARTVTCPACQRIGEQQPAGYVTIDAILAGQHRAAMVRLARNVEEREKAEHPLQRIMGIDDTAGALCITTTDPLLAHQLGQALGQAFHARARYSFAEDEHLMRVVVQP